jgi:hypothetical protein
VKRKILKEDIMANADRQTTSVGSGATDHPFYQMAVPTNPDAFKSPSNLVLPFEVDKFKTKLFDVLEKSILLLKDFQKASKNPSVKKSQKVAIKKCIKRLDYINQKLIDIPDFLDLFSVEK